jgi:hypothetical protein
MSLHSIAAERIRLEAALGARMERLELMEGKINEQLSQIG